MPYAYTEDQLAEQSAKASGLPSPRPSLIGEGPGRAEDGLTMI